MADAGPDREENVAVGEQIGQDMSAFSGAVVGTRQTRSASSICRTFHRPAINDGTNTIVAFGPQVPPVKYSMSVIAIGLPPSTAILLRMPPLSKATHPPSGEKNGLAGRSPGASHCGVRFCSDRTYRPRPSARLAAYARRVPSRENQSRNSNVPGSIRPLAGGSQTARPAQPVKKCSDKPASSDDADD